MADSALRPELNGPRDTSRSYYTPTNGDAYLMIYNAVRAKQQLIAGRLHKNGESCAIGSFWDVNPQCALQTGLIDEVAAINDSFRHVTGRQRRVGVLRWLRWKLHMLGMPGFARAKK